MQRASRGLGHVLSCACAWRAAGQFEKVQKTKNKWKVSLKDCIFHVAGKDYLVKKCQADIVWE
jgi:hypothetical protein